MEHVGGEVGGAEVVCGGGLGQEGSGQDLPTLGADSSPCSQSWLLSSSLFDLKQVLSDPQTLRGLKQNTAVLDPERCSVFLGQMGTEGK